MDIRKQILTALGIEKTNLEWQAKLTDGTIVVSTAPELEVGVDISILTEDGTSMPLPVGSYETEDGVGFVVEEDGIIAELLTEEQEAPSEATDDEAAEVVEAGEDTGENDDEAEVGDWAGMEKRIKNLEDAIADLKSKVDGGDAEVVEEVEAKAEPKKATPKTIKKTEVTEFEALKAENEELKAKLVELNKSAGAEALNLNRFSTAKKAKPLTKAELKKLTPQERFAYNINN
jgi:hypothetical protein